MAVVDHLVVTVPSRQINGVVKCNGDKRTRTADFLHAMQALYQLSYTPLSVLYYRLVFCNSSSLLMRRLSKNTKTHSSSSSYSCP